MGKAVSLGHFNYNAFDPARFKSMAQLENGDLSWIVPGKFIAFSGPLSKRRTLGPGLHSLLPNEYVPLFKQLGVSCVVRFNNKCYDKAVFERGGIKHVDLFYEDGGNPTEAILQAFLKLCETEQGAIAVHCKAGLGRTGSCIGCYMMKHYRMTAEEVIGWLRVVRPGSIIGPQQQFMRDSQARMWKEGELARARLTSAPNLSLAAAALAPGSPGAEESERDARAAGRSAAAGKYAADRSIESQGDVLRARRAQASPMGSPVSPKASASASRGGGEEALYASPSPGPNHGSPPSPGSPGKSSFGRFLGGWK